MLLDFNELRQLLITISQTDITEFALKSDEFELTIRKNSSVREEISPGLAATEGLKATLPSVTATNSQELVERRATDAAAEVQMPVSAPPMEQKSVEVISPMVGTFYRAPAPGEAAFVEVGDRIRLGQTVCIIEAMKLMNEIETEVSGQVIQILVQDGEPIEYGQPLMRINPN
nr:acetyl-CoA carboxylase biotin carboxyl carrier protein [Synechocystis sp. PCC 7509]